MDDWTRPIDLHLKAFEAMGAKTTYEGDNMNLPTNGSKLQGAHTSTWILLVLEQLLTQCLQQ